MKTSLPSIAKVAHEVNRAYCCRVLGDDSQVPWDEAPEWQKESVLAGVTAVVHGDAATPEEQHELWAARKLAEGWTYGEVKDVDAKTHPCLVPYSDLPPEQRAKDYLFRAVVEALR